jgi:hypothetical protein
MARTLWNIYESDRQGMTADLLEQFRRRAAADGVSPTSALVRLMRRYLARGFDDGQPEQAAQGEARPAEE